MKPHKVTALGLAHDRALEVYTSKKVEIDKPCNGKELLSLITKDKTIYGKTVVIVKKSRKYTIGA